MRLVWIGAFLTIAGLLTARSPLGLRIGNEVRELSDKLMLAVLRLTSEFEKDL